ncbi:MAG TPA: hypothetical protein VI462_03570 [Acidimicrobiia bacterium]
MADAVLFATVPERLVADRLQLQRLTREDEALYVAVLDFALHDEEALPVADTTGHQPGQSWKKIRRCLASSGARSECRLAPVSATHAG